MSESFKSRVFVALMWILTVIFSIGTALVAWNWIEPESFLAAIGFILLWGIMSKIGHFLAYAIVSAIRGME